MGNGTSSASSMSSSSSVSSPSTSLSYSTSECSSYLARLSEPMKKLCASRRGELQEGIAKQLTTTEEESLLDVLGQVMSEAASGGVAGQSDNGMDNHIDFAKGPQVTGGSHRKDELLRLLLENDLQIAKAQIQRQALNTMNSSENDGKIVAVQPCSYLEALVACLYYEQNLEMQIISTKIIMYLVDARLQELPLDRSENQAHGPSQLLRFRLGLLGAIPPLVLLTFQELEDLQLMGARVLAGLALQPSNRSAIAHSDGLRSLCILALSDEDNVRLMAVTAINRLLAKPWESKIVCVKCQTTYQNSLEGCPKCQHIEFATSDAGRIREGQNYEGSTLDQDIEESKNKREDEWKLLTRLPASRWLLHQTPAIQAGLLHLWNLYLDGGDSPEEISRAIARTSNALEADTNHVALQPSHDGTTSPLLTSIPHFNVEKILMLNGVRTLCTLLLRSLNDPGHPTDRTAEIPRQQHDSMHNSLQGRGISEPVSVPVADIHEMDRKISLVALHALHKLILGAHERVAHHLVMLRVELPHISLTSKISRKGKFSSHLSGATVSSQSFSGLDLVLMMTLPPKIQSMRVVASRLLVQLAAHSGNISAFQSVATMPFQQLQVIRTSLGGEEKADHSVEPSDKSLVVTNDRSGRHQPTALQLLRLVAEDKVAEVTANAVISMLHLSANPRLLTELMGLKVIPKMLSLVSAASANEAVQYRAMLALVSIAKMSARMSDAELRASQLASNGGQSGVDNVIIPVLVTMSKLGRNWAVRREAVQAMGLFALRSEIAAMIVKAGGFEEILGLAAESAYAFELMRKSKRVEILQGASKSHGHGHVDNIKENDPASILTKEELDDLSLLPSLSTIESCEHAAVQSAGVLMMHASVIDDLASRTEAFKMNLVSAVNHDSAWENISKRAQNFHRNSIIEFFGHRIDEAYDVSSALTQKNSLLLEPATQHGRLQEKAFEFVANENRMLRYERLQELAGEGVHSINVDEEDALLVKDAVNNANQTHAERNSKNLSSHGDKGRSDVPSRVQLHALLALAVIMPADHIAIYKPHWLNLFAYLLREPHDDILTTKAAAAVAHVADSPASCLRLISKTQDYSVARETWLDRILPPVRANTMMLSGMTEEEALLAVHNEDTLKGLDIVPDLVKILTKSGENVGAQREIARALCKLSSNPNGMLVWLRLVGSKTKIIHDTSSESFHDDQTVFGNTELTVEDSEFSSSNARTIAQDSPEAFSDIACECVTVIKGNPQLWFPNSNQDSTNSKSSAGRAFGVKFRKMDAVLLIPRKHAQDIISSSLASISSLEPREIVSPPGVPLKDGVDTPGLAEWTISTWFHVQKEFKTGTWSLGIGGKNPNAELNAFHSNTSLSSLTGEAGERYGNFATLCEGTNGDQHVCVRVCQDESPMTEREIELEQKRRENWEDEQEDILERMRGMPKHKQRNSINSTLNANFKPRARSRHELGSWDSSKRMWRSSGFDMSKLPSGWHHLVVIGSAGRTFFYIAASGKHKADGFKMVGIIPDFCSAAPILSVGNAVDLAHPFGIISNFRVYGSKIPEFVLNSPDTPFNSSPDNLSVTISASASGNFNLDSDTSVVDIQKPDFSKISGFHDNAEELARWHDLFSKFDKDGDGFLSEEEFTEALRVAEVNLSAEMVSKLFITVATDPAVGIHLSDFTFWLQPKQTSPSKDPAWAHLPERAAVQLLGEDASGVIPSLVAATQKGVQEISFWSCSALGNLASLQRNRIKIICAGGVDALLGPCNSKNPALAVEAARALVMLR